MLALVVAFKSFTPSFASTARGSEYQATTTTQATFQKDIAIQSVAGTLGSVIMTGPAVGVINLYDATTSDITQRAASLSTSSILLATLPVSSATTTYTFDENFYRGLYINIVGTIPTSTITYRQ